MSKNKDIVEIGSSLVKRYSEEMCLAENLKRIQCKGSIIGSHTIPKSNSLKKIARNGHVYTFMHLDFLKLNKNNGKLTADLIGIGKASTFKGFCGEHDRELFSCVETTDFNATPEQCFALFYRAYAKEVYNKKVQYNDKESGQIVIDKLETEILKSQASHFLNQYYDGIALSIKDINSLKPLMDKMLEESDYSKLKALVLEFDDPLPFMLSGAVYPEQDFDGNLLQQLGTKNFNSFTSLGCTSFSSNNKGFFVFSWLDVESEIVERFIGSFLNIQDKYKFNHLIKMVFYSFENVYLSPDWWEALGKEKRDYLSSIMNKGFLPNNPKPKNYLRDDGYKLPKIGIIGIKRINF